MTRRSIRGRDPALGLEGAQLWDWDDSELFDEAPARVPELHVVGGRASRRPEPAASSSTTSATVLPWPRHRRPDTLNDPDLPGGA